MSQPREIVIALGSNLGDRRYHLRQAVALLAEHVRIVRLSGVWESDPVDCPPGSGPFLNMVLAATTIHSPQELLERLHRVEDRIGRRRRRRNESRVIDLDLIFHGARLSERGPILPHPRYADRAFVLEPLLELGLDWTVAGRRIPRVSASGSLRRLGTLY